MSKYSFIWTGSPWRRQAWLLPIAGIAVTFCALSTSAKTWLPDSLFLTLLIIVIGGFIVFKLIRKRRGAQIPDRQPVVVHIDGRQWREKSCNDAFYVTARSRVLPFALFISLENAAGKKTHRWLFHSECEPLIYRRLARLILQ